MPGEKSQQEMDDLHTIRDITSLETAKVRRSARKGRLTRLSNKLTDFEAAPLNELQATLLARLRDDLVKETKLYNALQTKVEQLLEAKQGITEDDLTKEIDGCIMVGEAHSEIVLRADTLKQTLNYYLDAELIQQEVDTLMNHSDPSAGEFEKDCSRIQRKISTFLQQTASFHAPTVADSRRLFENYLVDITVKLKEGRSKRRERKVDMDASITERPKPSWGSKLRLDLPTFSGHPLEWHHFCELFTSALDRAGGVLRKGKGMLPP